LTDKERKGKIGIGCCSLADTIIIVYCKEDVQDNKPINLKKIKKDSVLSGKYFPGLIDMVFNRNYFPRIQ